MPKAGTTRAEYGHQHRKLRARIKVQVDLGNAYCWRCDKWIDPTTPWDLGHDDLDPNQYRGPEHRACNRATAGRSIRDPLSFRWDLGVPRRGRTCEVCGNKYDANHKAQRTCSRACGLEIQRRHRPPVQLLPDPPSPQRRACAECGLEFMARHSRVTICSDACRKKRANRKTGDYIKRRYREDPEFRQKVLDRSRASHEAKRWAI